MSTRAIPDTSNMTIFSQIWCSFDSTEDDKELWLLEQEVSQDLERIEQKNNDVFPIGYTTNEQSYVEEEYVEEEEEDDDNDNSEESESHVSDEEEEIDME